MSLVTGYCHRKFPDFRLGFVHSTNQRTCLSEQFIFATIRYIVGVRSECGTGNQYGRLFTGNP